MALHFIALIAAAWWIEGVLGQTVVPITAADKEEIVRAHNMVRSRVTSPPAADMTSLVYSDELAAVAENYALNCNFAHSEERSSETFGTSIGENIHLNSGRAVDYTTYIATNWGFEEKQFYNYRDNSCATGEVCGHYTQIIWASTRYVGCGTVLCPRVQNAFDFESTLFICNYGPAGNIVGQRPYTEGTPCSRCPTDLPVCSENLCGVAATQPPSTQPPTTLPPSTQPPATQPPSTQPPATQPPSTQPPATQPPSTQPPATQPLSTQTPATQAPSTQPPATQPPSTQPPATQLPSILPPETPPITTIERPILTNALEFVGNSPRVQGNRIFIDIGSREPMQSVQCFIDGLPSQDCSGGSVVFTISSVVSRRYLLRVVAQPRIGRKITIRRLIAVGPPNVCVINFINNGVTMVDANTVQVEFRSSGPVNSYLCSMDRGKLETCISGQCFSELEPGDHRIKVVPQKCGRSRLNAVMNFKV